MLSLFSTLSFCSRGDERLHRHAGLFEKIAIAVAAYDRLTSYRADRTDISCLAVAVRPTFRQRVVSRIR